MKSIAATAVVFALLSFACTSRTPASSADVSSAAPLKSSAGTTPLTPASSADVSSAAPLKSSAGTTPFVTGTYQCSGSIEGVPTTATVTLDVDTLRMNIRVPRLSVNHDGYATYGASPYVGSQHSLGNNVAYLSESHGEFYFYAYLSEFRSQSLRCTL